MQLSGKRILITGGAGFIGSHLVDALAGEQLTILDDFSTGHAANLEQHRNRPNVKVIRGDIRDPATVDEAMQNAQIVFHLACRGVRHSIGNPEESHAVNAAGAVVLLEAARKHGVERFVHVSTSEVYGTARHVPMDETHPCFPETVYGAAKLAGEAYARAYFRTYELPTIVVRPFNNFGPRSHFEGDSGEVIPRFAVWALNRRRPVIFGDGAQTRDFIYVEETAFWLCRAAECDALVGGTVNLGSGTETSILDLARIVYEAAGCPEIEPEFHPPRPGDVRRHLAGADVAREHLGFALRTSVADGIGRLLDHLRGRPEPPAELLAMIDEANWKLATGAQQLAQ